MPVPTLQQPIREAIDARLQQLERRRTQEQELDGLVAQIKKVREDLEGNVTKLQELSQQLRSQCRRNLGEESTSRYLVWTNAHLRVTGALSSGLRRTASMDRVLANAKAEIEEAKRRAEDEARWLEAREHQKTVNKMLLPTTDDFYEVFGDLVDEEVSDA